MTWLLARLDRIRSIEASPGHSGPLTVFRISPPLRVPRVAAARAQQRTHMLEPSEELVAIPAPTTNSSMEEIMAVAVPVPATNSSIEQPAAVAMAIPLPANNSSIEQLAAVAVPAPANQSPTPNSCPACRGRHRAHTCEKRQLADPDGMQPQAQKKRKSDFGFVRLLNRTAPPSAVDGDPPSTSGAFYTVEGFDGITRLCSEREVRLLRLEAVGDEPRWKCHGCTFKPPRGAKWWSQQRMLVCLCGKPMPQSGAQSGEVELDHNRNNPPAPAPAPPVVAAWQVAIEAVPVMATAMDADAPTVQATALPTVSVMEVGSAVRSEVRSEVLEDLRRVGVVDESGGDGGGGA